MAKKSQNKKQTSKKKENRDNLWRKPITLDLFEDEDPLATLYQGREVDAKQKEEKSSQKKQQVNTSESRAKKTKDSRKDVNSAKPKKSVVRKTPKSTKPVSKSKTNKKSKRATSTKVAEEELKNLLRIKSDSFEFTDIREILRGKSIDIYAYLSHLAGDTGICKITHNNLMKELNISRPTLFKQSDWLETLCLIEKSSVPGDHTGTSYTVRRLEDALPITDKLVEQLESYIEVVGKN